MRVLHGLSFIDDPTRILRAVRFEERYGFAMDPGTADAARRAVELDMLSEVSGARIREELLGILAEKTPGKALARLEELGALSELLPGGALVAGTPKAIETVEEALERLGDRFPRPPKRAVALVACIASASQRADAERWLRHYRFGKEYSPAALELAERGGKTLSALQDRRGMRDSRLYRMLSQMPAEAVVNLWARGDRLGRERIEHYVDVVSRVRMTVSGQDLIELGAPPSEAFSAILARTFDDLLDGRAVGRQAELANLKRLASRAGLIAPRKEPA